MKPLKSFWKRILAMKLFRSTARFEEQLELFRVDESLPEMVDFSTAEGRCLRLLLQGKTITESDFKSKVGGSSNLNRVIRKLHKKGWPIHGTCMLRASGRRGMVCEYFLYSDFISEITGKSGDG